MVNKGKKVGSGKAGGRKCASHWDSFNCCDPNMNTGWKPSGRSTKGNCVIRKKHSESSGRTKSYRGSFYRNTQTVSASTTPLAGTGAIKYRADNL